MKLKINSASVLEGNLYEVITEDARVASFHSDVLAVAADGRKFLHVAFLSKGDVNDEEGYRHAVDSREDAQAFAYKVADRGFIDTALWEEYVVAPLEERLHDEYLREIAAGERPY